MDYFIAECATSDRLGFSPVADVRCKAQEAPVIGMLMTLGGTTIDCVQDAALITAAINAGTAVMLYGIGTTPAPTENAVANRFGDCVGPTQYSIDKTYAAQFETPYIVGNHDVLNEILTEQTLGQLFILRKSGFFFRAEGAPSVIGGGFNGDDLLGVTINAEWKSTGLGATPFKAPTEYACNRAA